MKYREKVEIAMACWRFELPLISILKRIPLNYPVCIIISRLMLPTIN